MTEEEQGQEQIVIPIGERMDVEKDDDGTIRLPGNIVAEATREQIAGWVKEDNFYITRRGVVLRLSPVSAYFVKERGDMVEYPEIPMVMNEDKNRMEPDPTDKEFVRAQQRAEKEQSDITINTYLSMGVEIEFKPTDVPAPEDRSWSDPFEDETIFGRYAAKIPESGKARFIHWLKYVALSSDVDLLGCITQLQVIGGGVRTEAVVNALASFPDRIERNAPRKLDTPKSKRSTRKSR